MTYTNVKKILADKDAAVIEEYKELVMSLIHICLRKCLAVRYIFTAVIYFRIKDRIVYKSLCQIKTTVCVEPVSYTHLWYCSE